LPFESRGVADQKDSLASWPWDGHARMQDAMQMRMGALPAGKEIPSPLSIFMKEQERIVPGHLPEKCTLHMHAM
jgi:hypothetical protein